MKTNIFWGAFLGTALVFSVPVEGLAHPGRTDSNGCHYNTRTRVYHCYGTVSSRNDPSPSSIQVSNPIAAGNPNILSCANYTDCMIKGNEEYSRSNFRLALTFYKEALRYSPRDIPAFINLNFAEAYSSSLQSIPGSCSSYQECMNLGYRATERRDYHTALINFKRALIFSYNGQPAINAIQNVSRYIQELR